MLRSCMVAVAVVVAAFPSVGFAQFRDVTGQFIFEGAAPAPAAVSKPADPFCAKFPLTEDKLLVESATKGLANVVFALAPAAGVKVPENPAYAADAKAKVVHDNKDCKFVPHVAILRTTQTLVIKNSDTVGHNTKIDPLNNKGVNPIVPAGGEVAVSFPMPENLPVEVSCSIHPFMKSYMVVKDHPYVAVSGPDGKFTIKGVPEGEWPFMLWHESAGYVKGVTTTKAETLKKGRWTIKVEKGTGVQDLGVIKVSL